MNIMLDIPTAESAKYLLPHEFYQILEKRLGKDERHFLIV